MTTELVKFGETMTRAAGEISRTIGEWTEARDAALVVAREFSAALKSDADAKDAGAAIQLVADISRDVEHRRKVWTRPLVDAKRAIDDRCKEVSADLLAEEARLKRLCADYHNAKLEAEAKQIREARAAAARAEREQREAIERMRAAAAKGEPLPAIAPAPPPPVQPAPVAPVRATVGATTVRQIQKWRVVDADLVPRMFLKLDEPAIASALKLGIEIPGIEAYLEPSVSVRR